MPAVGAITLLAFALRLYRFDALSLWVDEGLSVAYSHLSWTTVLGFNGAYAPHPPLYFALVKAAAYLLPDGTAGRMISVIAGTLTIPFLYILVARLAGWASALASCLVLAVSPLHIWYSQEARPYALVALLVCVSYLAMVAFGQTRRHRWAWVYAAATALAMYVEYSAIYALLPQILLLLPLVRRQGRGAIPLVVAGGAAALAFFPWLPQLVTYAGPTSEQSQFALSSGKVGAIVVSVTGIGGYNDYFLGSVLAPWDRWPLLQPLFAVLIAGIALFGLVSLARRSRVAASTSAALALGVIVTAVLMSEFYPGITYRTVLSATLGWSILAGAVLVSPRTSPGVRVAGRVAVLVLLAISLLTLHAVYAGAFKQQYRLLAGDTASAARLSWPVMTYPVVTGTLISVYQPGSLAHHLQVGRKGQLPSAFLGSGRPPAVWYAYSQGQFFDRSVNALRRLGYHLLLESTYTGPLYLDLWAEPGARLGSVVPLNGTFRGHGLKALDWDLPVGADLVSDGLQGRQLLLRDSGKEEERAVESLPARSGALYVLHAEVRSRLKTGIVRAFLICTAANDSFTAVAPNGAGASAPPDGLWHAMQIAVVCPAGSDGLLIDLRNSGEGDVAFRRVEVRAREPGR